MAGITRLRNQCSSLNEHLYLKKKKKWFDHLSVDVVVSNRRNTIFWTVYFNFWRLYSPKRHYNIYS